MKPNDLKGYWPTQTAIGQALGLNQSTVSEWFRSGRIPYARQVQINRLVGLPVEEPSFLANPAPAKQPESID